MSTVSNKCDLSGNRINIKVKYLDDHVECFTLNGNSLGSDLFQKISIRMQLIESYFFGLQYLSLESDLCWLDMRKSIRKQTDYKNEFSYEFCIKFYTPDPNLLHDNLTKKLFVLQIKKDVTNGELICSESTKILLGGLFLQLHYLEAVTLQIEDAEHFLINLFNDHCLSSEFIDQCLKFHKTLQCQTAIETHFDLLEIVRKIDFYGMKLHPAKDNEGLSINLAVYHMGIVIFQKYTKINTFNWSKIRKLSFKRKRFLIKLHPEEYLELFVLWVVQGFYKDTLEFYFESRNSCKNFWKKCIEHHAFFRTHSNLSCSFSSQLQSESHFKLNRKQKFRRSFSGSRFRYIGLTQYELEQFHKITYQIENSFQKSESTGRLTSPSLSFLHFPRMNSEKEYSSNHSLSLLVKPSISNSLDNTELEICENHNTVKHNCKRCNNLNKNDKFLCFETADHLPQIIGSDDLEADFSMCSNENEPTSFVENKNQSDKYLPSTSTSNETVPLSLIDVPIFDIDKEYPDSSFKDGNFHLNFDEYGFVPNILAQISQSQCSISTITMNFQAMNILDSNKSSVDFSSDNISSETILKCMEKEFLFNEFTFLKELQNLNKITTSYLDICKNFTQFVRGLQHHLNQIEMATSLLVTKLEHIIQLNIQSVTTSWNHTQKFISIISEFNSRTKDNLKCYINELKEFIHALINSNFSTNCFHLPQTENDLENRKNSLRLFVTPIIQQRAHLSCLSVFILFISSNDEKLICQDIIFDMKESLIMAEGVEEFAHVGVVAGWVKGLLIQEKLEFNTIVQYFPVRIGWLQKLSKKGASNRLFILLPDYLICSRKSPSMNFTIEHRWVLSNIRVGTLSDMTKSTNGYDPHLSPFDSITIMLCDVSTTDSRYSSVILLADSNRSRSVWIEDIKKTSSASNLPKVNHDNSTEESLAKIHVSNDIKFWIENYRFIDICWHNRISISKLHLEYLFQFSLSAYLLRKYNSSNNWQRLWVVLSDCHLFFYQSHSCKLPITSMCLVGFKTSEPILNDSITKLWVIKLEKESKTCFLRTENEYFYNRWRTALSYCTFPNA